MDLLRERLEIQHRRDTIIGLCIGRQQNRCHDGFSDRFDQHAMVVYWTDYSNVRKTKAATHGRSPTCPIVRLWEAGEVDCMHRRDQTWRLVSYPLIELVLLTHNW